MLTDVSFVRDGASLISKSLQTEVELYFMENLKKVFKKIIHLNARQTLMLFHCLKSIKNLKSHNIKKNTGMIRLINDKLIYSGMINSGDLILSKNFLKTFLIVFYALIKNN